MKRKKEKRKRVKQTRKRQLQKTGLVFYFPEARPQQARAVVGTWAQGSREVSMVRAHLLPRDSSCSVNWFVHSAEKPSSRPDWLGKQVSEFPPKSGDFHS